MTGNVLDPRSTPTISEIVPSETSGRDTIARFQAQFRAAAYACLAILKGESIDRVYCDYHDDFVCREPSPGHSIYHFYQVKTVAKRNHQWSRPELFGLPKRKKPIIEKVSGSFVGKLIMHTIRFKNSCGNVIFLTNVQLDDEMEVVAKALEKGEVYPAALKLFIECFNDAFVKGEPLDADAIENLVRRLKIRPGISYLHPQDGDFDALARKAIFEYSEVDLEHFECEEIINSLVALVQKKSFSSALSSMNEDELDDAAGVGISDLLEILSISKGAYAELRAGGDPKALKSASIIQRKLSKAGASSDIIEYCSKWKVSWDVWLREKRHALSEFDLNALLDSLNAIQNRWSSGQIAFSNLANEIDALWTNMASYLKPILSRDLLLGGVLSALVRSEAQ